MRLTLKKSEKLCSPTIIDALFARPDAKGELAFPLRMVWLPRALCPGQPRVRFFISVPKKRLRHAVDRVTMRRRIREAYRLSRHLIPEGVCADVGFIYVAPGLRPYERVQSAMSRLLPRLLPSASDD